MGGKQDQKKTRRKEKRGKNDRKRGKEVKCMGGEGEGKVSAVYRQHRRWTREREEWEERRKEKKRGEEEGKGEDGLKPCANWACEGSKHRKLETPVALPSPLFPLPSTPLP